MANKDSHKGISILGINEEIGFSVKQPSFWQWKRTQLYGAKKKLVEKKRKDWWSIYWLKKTQDSWETAEHILLGNITQIWRNENNYCIVQRRN